MIIETSGYADALQSALRGLAYGGTISYVALPNRLPKVLTSDAKPISITPKLFLPCVQRAEPGLSALSRKRIEETCWELLMNGYLNCEDLIDPVVTFANSPESYMQYVDQHPEQSIKWASRFNSKE